MHLIHVTPVGLGMLHDIWIIMAVDHNWSTQDNRTKIYLLSHFLESVITPNVIVYCLLIYNLYFFFTKRVTF